MLCSLREQLCGLGCSSWVSPERISEGGAASFLGQEIWRFLPSVCGLTVQGQGCSRPRGHSYSLGICVAMLCMPRRMYVTELSVPVLESKRS